MVEHNYTAEKKKLKRNCANNGQIYRPPSPTTRIAFGALWVWIKSIIDFTGLYKTVVKSNSVELFARCYLNNEYSLLLQNSRVCFKKLVCGSMVTTVIRVQRGDSRRSISPFVRSRRRTTWSIICWRKGKLTSWVDMICRFFKHVSVLLHWTIYFIYLFIIFSEQMQEQFYL